MNPKMQEAREKWFATASRRRRTGFKAGWNAAIEAAAKAARDGLYGGFAEREYLIERVLALKDPTP